MVHNPDAGEESLTLNMRMIFGQALVTVLVLRTGSIFGKDSQKEPQFLPEALA